MTFDELIAQAIRETLDEKCAEYDTDGKKHHFSLAYKIARRSTIISARKRKPLSIRRIRYILLAILFVLFALLGFGLWRTFGGYSFNVFKDHSRVYLNNDKTIIEIEEIYGLPEEYELLSILPYNTLIISQYLVDEKNVTLSQYLAWSAVETNTENNTAEYVTVNGYDGYFINNCVDDEVNLSWIMDGYQFYLTGKIDKNTALVLAQLIKIRNFDKIP